jgi:hypothetical protein
VRFYHFEVVIVRGLDQLGDLDKQVAALDSAPALEITSSAKPRTAAGIAAQAKAQAEANKLRIAEEQRRQAKRDALSAKHDVEAGELARLRTVRAEVASQAQAAEAEVGPVRIVAEIIGVDPGKVVAAAVASIYDALCVLLLLTGGHNPAAPATAEQPAVALRRPTRSEAAKKGWETRRRKALEAAYRRGPVRVQ